MTLLSYSTYEFSKKHGIEKLSPDTKIHILLKLFNRLTKRLFNLLRITIAFKSSTLIFLLIIILFDYLISADKIKNFETFHFGSLEDNDLFEEQPK